MRNRISFHIQRALRDGARSQLRILRGTRNLPERLSKFIIRGNLQDELNEFGFPGGEEIGHAASSRIQARRKTLHRRFICCRGSQSRCARAGPAMPSRDRNWGSNNRWRSDAASFRASPEATRIPQEESTISKAPPIAVVTTGSLDKSASM